MKWVLSADLIGVEGASELVEGDSEGVKDASE
jgi:hypothetical protein